MPVTPNTQIGADGVRQAINSVRDTTDLTDDEKVLAGLRHWGNDAIEASGALATDAEVAGALAPYLTSASANSTYESLGTSADGVYHVTATGNNANNGLSAGSAKATLAAAVTAGARHVIFGKGTFTPAAFTLGAGRTLILEGQGNEETYLDFSGLGGSAIALDLLAGANRGTELRNLTILGPGIGTSVTGIRPYHGLRLSNVRVYGFGIGLNIGGYNGIQLDHTAEFSSCGIGVKTTAGGNKNDLGARYFNCVNGVDLGSAQNNFEGAWFEGCSGTEIILRDAQSIPIRGVWIENTRTDPPIYLNPTTTSYPNPVVVTLADSTLVLGAGATAFLRVNQAASVTVENLYLGDAAYNSVLVDGWLMGLFDRGVYAATVDGETSLTVRTPVRVTGAGKLYEVSMPPDMAARPFSPPFPMFAREQHVALANLLSDSGFETALSSSAGGATPPTVTWDTDANFGAKCCKTVFPLAQAGTASYVTIDRNFAATAGQQYVIEFSAKANKAFRAVALRLFNVTDGAFEPVPLTFLDLGTGYRRFRVLWTAPLSKTYRLAFYKVPVTTNDISLWVDDVAVWTGSIPGVYVPQVTASIPKGTIGAPVLWGQRVIGRGTPLVATDFALSAGWGDTPTASADTIVATDQGGTFRVLSGSANLGASPTITITFKDGAWPQAPIVMCVRNGGNSGTVLPTFTVSTTQIVITFPDTPVGSGAFLFAFMVIG